MTPCSPLVLVPIFGAIALRPQDAPKREELPKSPLVVRVVDVASKQPVAGIDVTCVATAAIDAENERRWCGLEQWLDANELDEVTRASGTTRKSDEHGIATFERPAGELRLMAEDEERFGVCRLATGSAGDVTLPIHVEPSDEVFVVDAAGKPVGGVPVAIGWGSGIPEGMPAEMAESMKKDHFFADTIDDAWPAAFEGVATSRASDGRVRLPHAGKWLTSAGASSEVAVLAFPATPRVEIRLAAKPDREHRVLVLPPTGSVVLRFPGVAHGVAQLRNATEKFWRDFEPARAAIVDGVATFPLVGVGTKLQFRATWEGLSSPLEGVLDGPERAGDVVKFEATAKAVIPVFLARLVDEDRRPVASQKLTFSVRWQTTANGGDDGKNFEVTTEKDGGVRFTLDHDAAEGLRRWMEISRPWYVKESPFGEAGTTIDLSRKFPAGTNDLGEVVLHEPGSRKWVRTLSDAELERVYLDAANRRIAFSSDVVHDADTCLTEMIERSGAHWEQFISAQMRSQPHESIEQADEPGGANGSRVWISPVLLTALRRVQRKKDPFVLEVEGGPVIETTYPDVPVIHYRIRNQDEGGESLFATSWEFERSIACRADVRESDGSVAAGQKPDETMNSGGITDEVVAPGESRESVIDLPDQFFFPHSGEFTVRLLHRHGNDDFTRARGSLDGWICSRSEPFTIRVLPKSVACSAAERTRLRERFAAIDFSKPRILSGPWEPGDEFTGPAVTPEDDLYRAGWSAIPVLLDELDDAAATPDARAWALALLTDITALNHPGYNGPAEVSALGRILTPMKWPRVKLPENVHVLGESPASGPAQPDPVEQARLIESWHRTRKSLELREH